MICISNFSQECQKGQGNRETCIDFTNAKIKILAYTVTWTLLYVRALDYQVNFLFPVRTYPLYWLLCSCSALSRFGGGSCTLQATDQGRSSIVYMYTNGIHRNSLNYRVFACKSLVKVEVKGRERERNICMCTYMCVCVCVCFINIFYVDIKDIELVNWISTVGDCSK